MSPSAATVVPLAVPTPFPPSEITAGFAQVSPATLVQVTPSPVKPALHTQMRLPGVLVQVASALQPPLLVAHSLTSVQTNPLPSQPALQVQRKLPGRFSQVACPS